MEEIIEQLTEEDATQIKQLISEGLAAIDKAQAQIARDNEEIEGNRRRSAFLMADTLSVLDKLERN